MSLVLAPPDFLEGVKEIYIISGDNETPTRNLAQQLGIDHYYAETLPQDKASIIEALQNSGRVVCYIGDGINDSIALSKAQVSVSLSGASSVAVDTAQVILTAKNLVPLVALFHYGQHYKRYSQGTFAAVVIPSVIGMVSAIFAPYALALALFWNIVAFLTGTSMGILSVWQYRLEANDQFAKWLPPSLRLRHPHHLLPAVNKSD